MKRIIFSVWSDVTEEHQSVPNTKKQAFAEYKDRLIEAQKKYAHLCGAEYEIFQPEISNYDDIQFYKLHQFENLTRDYDEIVYLDLDVIPTTKENIFKRHAYKENVGAYFVDVNPNWTNRINDTWWIDTMNLDKMSMIVKLCCKKAMLDLNDVYGDNTIVNTGVLIGNKNSIENFRLIERLEEADQVFKETLEDNMYPPDISNNFARNNEVYFSFITECYGVPVNNIHLSWNWLVDRVFSSKNPNAYLQHVVNKKFSVFTEYLS